MEAIAERPRFLVVDHNCDSRFLLVKCLLRKFPDAIIEETENGEIAAAIARRADITAVVSHRTAEHLGVELVAAFRAVNPSVPIVMVSGIDRMPPALAAGADRFLLYDEWLRLGTVVHDLLLDRARGATGARLAAT